MHAPKNRNSQGTLLEPFAVGLQSWANWTHAETVMLDQRFECVSKGRLIGKPRSRSKGVPHETVWETSDRKGVNHRFRRTKGAVDGLEPALLYMNIAPDRRGAVIITRKQENVLLLWPFRNGVLHSEGLQVWFAPVSRKPTFQGLW